MIEPCAPLQVMVLEAVCGPFGVLSPDVLFTTTQEKPATFHPLQRPGEHLSASL